MISSHTFLKISQKGSSSFCTAWPQLGCGSSALEQLVSVEPLCSLLLFVLFLCLSQKEWMRSISPFHLSSLLLPSSINSNSFFSPTYHRSLPLLSSKISSPNLPLPLKRNSVTSTILYMRAILISLYYFLQLSLMILFNRLMAFLNLDCQTQILQGLPSGQALSDLRPLVPHHFVPLRQYSLLLLAPLTNNNRCVQVVVVSAQAGRYRSRHCLPVLPRMEYQHYMVFAIWLHFFKPSYYFRCLRILSQAQVHGRRSGIDGRLYYQPNNTEFIKQGSLASYCVGCTIITQLSQCPSLSQSFFALTSYTISPFIQLQIQMREAITNLCKQQNSSLQRLLQLHNLDAKTSSKAQKYYRQIRKIYHHFDTHTYHLEDLMRAAIVIAEKSQLVYNVRGERVKGLALSLNEMIKQNHGLGKLVGIVKVFITHSKALEEELREDLMQVMQEVTFGHNFVEKFQRAMDYFDFQERAEEAVGYKSVFKSFTWLFFLQSRQALAIMSQFQSDYLLISVLYLTVRYAFDYLRPKHIPHLDRSRSTQKHLVTSILQNLFQIFLIDDITSFKRITSMVDDYFETLIANGTIKCINLQGYDFLSPKLININYRRIDSAYQKLRNPSSIDYRLFYNSRLETLTPRRFSQISQVKDAQHHKKGNFKQKSFASHKILTFEPQEPTSKLEQSEKFQQIKLPMNVKVSPSNTKTPMIWAYQQSPCSPIENFMHREVRLSKMQSQRCRDQPQIIDCIRKVLGEYCDNLQLLEDKVYLTYNYYLVLMDKYLKQNCEEDSNQLHSSGLVYALEIMICSVAVTAIEPERVRTLLRDIREYIETNGFYLWLINNFYQKVRDRLPSQIRELVTVMDELIINELIWQDDHISDSFLEIYHTNLCRNSGKENANMANLLERVIQHIEDHVAKLMSEFLALQNCEEIQSLIGRTIKYIILQTPELIKTHNLLQIILCSFYLVFRTHGASVKFNEIVTAFQQINNLKPTLYKRIINEIEIEEKQGVVSCNIIEFYNKYFLPFIREHRREIECWQYKPIKAVGNSARSQKKEEPARFSFKTMKENHQRRHIPTQESSSKKSLRMKSQASSPPVQTEPSAKENPDRLEASSTRNQTTMRSRPITALLSHLNTQKIKSPLNIR